ncbi:MAG: hypothetical protein DRN71_03550 [Candidatus Nanohalarchaeota archaeon]|nr:MAG: hypothetical protein DRN71_03550 [Candidatus Nanohaloarchaeota archaeon]
MNSKIKKSGYGKYFYDKCFFFDDFKSTFQLLKHNHEPLSALEQQLTRQVSITEKIYIPPKLEISEK